MVRTAILVMMVGAMAGCCGGFPSDYELRLDPALTPAQSERVLDAAAEWSAKTGVHTTTIVSAWPCTETDAARGRGCVYVQYVSPEQAQGLCNDGTPDRIYMGCDVGIKGEWTTVYLTEMDSGIDAYTIALHELGHAWGLAHDTGNAVMASPFNFCAHYVTDRDVAQYQTLRR